MSKQKSKTRVVSGTCEWTADGPGKYLTDCGHAYFPFIREFDQPKIQVVDGVEVCPWCSKEINYIGEDEDEE